MRHVTLFEQSQDGFYLFGPLAEHGIDRSRDFLQTEASRCRFDLIAELPHAGGEIVVYPRVQRFAQFQHLPVMDGEVTLTFLIPGQISD